MPFILNNNTNTLIKIIIKHLIELDIGKNRDINNFFISASKNIIKCG